MIAPSIVPLIALIALSIRRCLRHPNLSRFPEYLLSSLYSGISSQIISTITPSNCRGVSLLIRMSLECLWWPLCGLQLHRSGNWWKVSFWITPTIIRHLWDISFKRMEFELWTGDSSIALRWGSICLHGFGLPREKKHKWYNYFRNVIDTQGIVGGVIDTQGIDGDVIVIRYSTNWWR